MRVLKVFKNPFGDRGSTAISEWLLTVPKMPVDTHLSDCGLTSVGFESLLEAVRSKHTPGCPPLWLRIHGHAVGPTCIQRAGKDICFAENEGCKPSAARAGPQPTST